MPIARTNKIRKRLLLHHAIDGSTETSSSALYTLYGVQSIDEIACDDLSKRLTLLETAGSRHPSTQGETRGKVHGKTIFEHFGISRAL